MKKEKYHAFSIKSQSHGPKSQPGAVLVPGSFFLFFFCALGLFLVLLTLYPHTVTVRCVSEGNLREYKSGRQFSGAQGFS